MAVGTNDRKEKLVAGPTWTAQEPEDETEPHVTVHPSTFQMVCIILVQTINSADWAVILPIDVDVADYIGESAAYASFLVAALYIPFLPSLWLFRVITERSYKWAYLSWAVCCVVGNGLYVFVLMYADNLVLFLPPPAQCKRGVTHWAAGVKMCVTARYQPPATALFLVLARFIQGMAQCITYTNKQVIALTTSHDVRNGYQAYYQAGRVLFFLYPRLPSGWCSHERSGQPVSQHASCRRCRRATSRASRSARWCAPSSPSASARR